MPHTRQSEDRFSSHDLTALVKGHGIDRSRPLGPQIYEIIRMAIVQEILEPNDPINENELSQALGVSRTPLREAYQRLIDDGLINSQAKAGTFVSPIDQARVHEGIVIRRALEREVVTLLCKLQPDFRSLDGILALQGVAVSHRDHLEFYRQDERFHEALAELAGIPSAWRLAHSVKSHTDRARIMLTGNLPNRINVAYKEHLALMDALRDGDADLSQHLVEKHINSAFEAVEDNATS